MASSAETVLLDTSVAIALVQPDHVGFREVREALRGSRLGLAGHAAFETYSVLTRLPPPLRITPHQARRLLEHNFPATCHLSADGAVRLVAELAAHGVAGGLVYDALVGAAAREVGLPLVSRDRRAAAVYRSVGVEVRLIG